MTNTIETESLVVAEGQNLIKACLFNLIVVAEDVESGMHCQELVRIITEKFPCRIIFVRTDPTIQSDFLQITRSVQTIGSGATCVCCDQIAIDASANQLQKIPFLIFPQIVPDLPIYILLSKDPTIPSPIVSMLQQYATRIIYDVPAITNYEQFSASILKMFGDHPSSNFIDMHWTRTKAWREVLARVFATPEKLRALALSKNVQISYVESPSNNPHRSEIQSIYLQAWLATALQWELVSVTREGSSTRISYKYTNNSITVSITPKDTGTLDQGAIYSFEAMSYNESHVLISHERESKHVTVHASDPQQCQMPYTLFLSNYQRGPALVGEVFYQPVSIHYRKMIEYLNNKAWGA